VYNGIRKIEEVMEYIETHITEELNYEVMASMMSLSLYEFRRIFSFVIGCPISEYVRKRRLSLAALEIVGSSEVDLARIGEKYGYSGQAAFSKAFAEFHGCPPSLVKSRQSLNLFTVPSISFAIKGRETVPFKLISEPEFYIDGYTGESELTDSCCCEAVWKEFYDGGYDGKIMGDKIYVSYKNSGGNVTCRIGESGDVGELVPASRWACFTVNTVEDEIINEMYGKIIYELIPSANLTRDESKPTIEVYPADMSEDGFVWEIRIPVK